jgi:hypothetical protein
MSIALTDVTLCAADCAHPALAARALGNSLQQCRFGDAILFTDIEAEGPFRTVKIPSLCSRDDYSAFILKRLCKEISTAYVLIIQADGYVINANAWRAEFKSYDYVGSVWPWYEDGMTVGNGGFSLRSKRLLEMTADPRFTQAGTLNEDDLICRFHRRALEARGIRFAPESVANQFAYERGTTGGPTFGFHGLFNMWRHVSDEDMMAIVHFFTTETLHSREYLELIAQYLAMNKFQAATVLIARLRALSPASGIKELAHRFFNDRSYADHFVRQCDDLSVRP